MIELWCIGKTKERWISQGIEKYTNRLNPFVRFQIQFLKDTKTSNVRDKKNNDENEVLKKLMPSDYLVLLDEAGERFTSVQFAQKIAHMRVVVHNKIVFLVGGAYGFSDQIYARANEKISLSPMTMPHDLVRIVFLEQIYRAFSIINNKNYHHE